MVVVLMAAVAMAVEATAVAVLAVEGLEGAEKEAVVVAGVGEG